MKKYSAFMAGILSLLLVFGLLLTGCPMDGGDDDDTPAAVTDMNLTGKVTAPVRGATPVTTVSETPQYTGTITWQTAGGTAVSGNFAAGTVYKAVVTLTAKDGFTFTGVVASGFTHNAATSVTNDKDSGTVTINFPATAAEGADTSVNILDLTGEVTAPVKDAAPTTTAINTTQYTGTIAWQTTAGAPVSGNFAAGTVYKAVVTLTVKTGFTFTGVAANAFTHSGATVTNAAGSGTVTITFPATAAAGADPTPPGGGEYTLLWGVWEDVNYEFISGNFSSYGLPLTSAGSNAGYLTGSNATSAYNIISTTPEAQFNDDGTLSGSFEELLNYQSQGIGAPSALKSALTAQKSNVPLVDVFQHQYGVTAFYITKN
jgi:hypothetical protein